MSLKIEYRLASFIMRHIWGEVEVLNIIASSKSTSISLNRHGIEPSFATLASALPIALKHQLKTSPMLVFSHLLPVRYSYYSSTYQVVGSCRAVAIFTPHLHYRRFPTAFLGQASSSSTAEWGRCISFVQITFSYFIQADSAQKTQQVVVDSTSASHEMQRGIVEYQLHRDSA